MRRRDFVKGMLGSLGLMVFLSSKDLLKEKESEENVPMWLSSANKREDVDLVHKVFIDGEDVTDKCTAFWGAKEAGITVEGWVELLCIDKGWVTRWDDHRNKVGRDIRYGSIYWVKSIL